MLFLKAGGVMKCSMPPKDGSTIEINTLFVLRQNRFWHLAECHVEQLLQMAPEHINILEQPRQREQAGGKSVQMELFVFGLKKKKYTQTHFYIIPVENTSLWTCAYVCFNFNSVVRIIVEELWINHVWKRVWTAGKSLPGCRTPSCADWASEAAVWQALLVSPRQTCRRSSALLRHLTNTLQAVLKALPSADLKQNSSGQKAHCENKIGGCSNEKPEIVVTGFVWFLEMSKVPRQIYLEMLQQ